MSAVIIIKGIRCKPKLGFKQAKSLFEFFEQWKSCLIKILTLKVFDITIAKVWLELLYVHDDVQEKVPYNMLELKRKRIHFYVSDINLYHDHVIEKFVIQLCLMLNRTPIVLNYSVRSRVVWNNYLWIKVCYSHNWE